jgi:hypothetical protein
VPAPGRADVDLDVATADDVEPLVSSRSPFDTLRHSRPGIPWPVIGVVSTGGHSCRTSAADNTNSASTREPGDDVGPAPKAAAEPEVEPEEVAVLAELSGDAPGGRSS